MFRSIRSNPGLWSRIRNSHPLAGALRAGELEHLFQQERARADRSGRCFSMVVFVQEDGKLDGHSSLVALVRERMRIYDALGRLDSHRLALLLPEADSRGAWTFADAIVARCEEQRVRVQCEVFSYPIDWTLSDTPPAGGDRRKHPLRIADDDGAEFADADPASEAPSSSEAKPTGTDGPMLAVRTAERQSPTRPVQDIAPLFVQPISVPRRVIDVVVSTLGLVLLSPLFAVAALCIKLTSPGPVIFRQQRAGLGGKPFTFYKFRSMTVDAEKKLDEVRHRNIHAKGPIFKDRADKRITPVGRLLRKSSIDELPQLYNVLKGDMTLIGPRPPKLDEVEKYEPWQRRRLEVMGGLTCIWQVSGRSEVGFEDWVRMDIQYQEKRSFLFDLKLVFRTIGAVLSGRGAY